jgi:hypothetical protein
MFGQNWDLEVDFADEMLLFADDSTLIATTPADLQCIC